MRNKTIGILGATGYVGMEAVKTILEFTEYNVILGGRNPAKIHELFPDLKLRGNSLLVDIDRLDLLRKFCRKCDLVINCAGPSKQILDRVASVAIEESIHYVDVAGDDYLYKLMVERQKEIKDKKLALIISAGMYPGLSGVFPAYIAENNFDNINLLETYFAGQGKLSFNAAYDYICSIEEDYGEGMAYYKNGKVKKTNGNFHKKIVLPHPASEFDAYPVLTQEFKRIVKRYRIKSAYFYNTYQNKSVLNTLITIKVLEQYKTEAQKRESAKLLTQQFLYDTQNTSDFTMFHLIAEGNKNANSIQIVSTLLFNGDGNSLSGIIAANTAILIMDGGNNGFGCFFLPEGVNINKFMDVLSKQNIYPEQKIIDLNVNVKVS